MFKNILRMVGMGMVILMVCTGCSTSATPEATSTIVSQPVINTEAALSSATQMSLSPTSVPDMVDVTYHPPTRKYQEMEIVSGSTVECDFTNKNVVKFTNSSDSLTITSSLPAKSITITPSEVEAYDANNDGWVKLPTLGNISVGYMDGEWKSDWLLGCPLPLSTPAAP